MAILDGGDWWGDGNPARIDIRFKVGHGPQTPESYPFAAEALAALIARLPTFVDWITETLRDAEVGLANESDIDYLAAARRRRAAVTGLAARLGVEFSDAHLENVRARVAMTGPIVDLERAFDEPTDEAT